MADPADDRLGARALLAVITPEPGSHLARVDCAGCLRFVYAVPERVDDALCVECRRDRCGAHATSVPPPASWFGADVTAVRRRPAGAQEVAASAPAGTYRASCPKAAPCLWWAWAPDARQAVVMERVHFTVRHDPSGWASGTAGGMRPRGRR